MLSLALTSMYCINLLMYEAGGVSMSRRLLTEDGAKEQKERADRAQQIISQVAETTKIDPNVVSWFLAPDSGSCERYRFDPVSYSRTFFELPVSKWEEIKNVINVVDGPQLSEFSQFIRNHHAFLQCALGRWDARTVHESMRVLSSCTGTEIPEMFRIFDFRTLHNFGFVELQIRHSYSNKQHGQYLRTNPESQDLAGIDVNGVREEVQFTTWIAHPSLAGSQRCVKLETKTKTKQFLGIRNGQIATVDVTVGDAADESHETNFIVHTHPGGDSRFGNQVRFESAALRGKFIAIDASADGMSTTLKLLERISKQQMELSRVGWRW